MKKDKQPFPDFYVAMVSASEGREHNPFNIFKIYIPMQTGLTGTQLLQLY